MAGDSETDAKLGLGTAEPEAGIDPHSGAVFLSYASQDTSVAERIAGALRGAGIEVWFDRSELRGGDAWDQTIRQQIRDCRLFLPIISRTTQARAEGYFRLEWRLADQRTHLMGRNKAFLLPICVDETPEPGADVPDSFSAVQWTRLPEGSPTPAFIARVARLLHSPLTATTAGPSPLVDRMPSAPSRSRWWIGLGVAVTVAVAAIGYAVTRRELVVPPQTTDKLPRQAASPAISAKSVAVLPFTDMSEKHDTQLDNLKVDPDLRGLPGDPRYHALLVKLNFAE